MLEVSNLRLEILDLRFALDQPFVTIGELLCLLSDLLIAIEHLLMCIDHQLLKGVDVAGKFSECHAFVIRDERNDIRCSTDLQEKNADFLKKLRRPVWRESRTTLGAFEVDAFEDQS